MAQRKKWFSSQAAMSASSPRSALRRAIAALTSGAFTTSRGRYTAVAAAVGGEDGVVDGDGVGIGIDGRATYSVKSYSTVIGAWSLNLTVL